jgi:flagellar hook protein FlgE
MPIEHASYVLLGIQRSKKPMISALQNGVQGMERASDVVNTAASDIANAATPPNVKSPPSGGVSRGDIGQDMVSMVVGNRTYDANAKVVEVAARMLDTIV